MHAFQSSFGLLAYSSAVLAQQVRFPGTLEVDLVFPRNATYSPTQLFPFVFAIQNPLLAIPLDLSINYVLFSFGTTDGSNASDISINGNIALRNDNFSSRDPYLAYQFTTQLNVTEGAWLLTWTVGSGNCSANPESGRTDLSYLNRDAHVMFTTKKGAPSVDLVAAADAGTCPANTSSLTYNITGTLDTPDPSKFDGRNSCAVLSSPSPSPAANPCGAKIDAAAASSISAAITATHCAFPHPMVSCPPADNAAGSKALEGLGWLAVTVGWGACLLLL